MARRRRPEDEEDIEQSAPASVRAYVSDFVHRELQDIGLEKVAKLERMYGPDDKRTKKAKVDAFFRAYSIVGTVDFAAQIVGINPRLMTKLINDPDKPQWGRRFDQAHEEFCQYLEQTAIMRALAKSDALLMFLLRANKPRKFSERMRIQASTEDDNRSPVQIVFGEYGSEWEEPNYLIPPTEGETEEEVEEEVDDNDGVDG